ncbi:MAG: MarR family winged helix-turn-helix transcriptional regulator [Pseudorhodoplanes sp.]
MPKIEATRTRDAIDRFAEEWTCERPDLDFSYLETVGRILRLSAHLREEMDRWLASFGITWEMFDLLASLQRSGSEAGLRPTDLYEACMLSSGATTNRIDRAEKLNYATRRQDAADGRSIRIALTKQGAALARRAMTKHAGCAGAIARRLNMKEREQLARLLRKLLLSFESEAAAAEKVQRNAPRAAHPRSSARERGPRAVSLKPRRGGSERSAASARTKQV